MNKKVRLQYEAIAVANWSTTSQFPPLAHNRKVVTSPVTHAIALSAPIVPRSQAKVMVQKAQKAARWDCTTDFTDCPVCGQKFAAPIGTALRVSCPVCGFKFRPGFDTQEVPGDVKENAELSPKQKEYQRFFQAMLKKHGVKSPAELPAAKKKAFFQAVKKEWAAKKKGQKESCVVTPSDTSLFVEIARHLEEEGIYWEGSPSEGFVIEGKAEDLAPFIMLIDQDAVIETTMAADVQPPHPVTLPQAAEFFKKRYYEELPRTVNSLRNLFGNVARGYKISAKVVGDKLHMTVHAPKSDKNELELSKLIQSMGSSNVDVTVTYQAGVFSVVFDTEMSLLNVPWYNPHFQNKVEEGIVVSDSSFPLVELTAKDIKAGIDKKIRDRAKGVKAVLKKVYPDGTLIFECKGSKTWIQTVELVEWRDALQLHAPDLKTYKDRANLILNGHIKVGCNCPSFMYDYAYIATQLDMKHGKSQNVKPKKRNADLEGVVCKHLSRVILDLNAGDTIQKLAGELKKLHKKGQIHIAGLDDQ